MLLLLSLHPITNHCWNWYGFRQRLQRCINTSRTRRIVVLVCDSYCLLLLLLSLLPITNHCWKWYGFWQRLQRCVNTSRTRRVVVLVFGSYCLLLLLSDISLHVNWTLNGNYWGSVHSNSNSNGNYFKNGNWIVTEIIVSELNSNSNGNSLLNVERKLLWVYLLL